MMRVLLVAAALAAVAVASKKAEDLQTSKPGSSFFVPSHCARTRRYVSKADNTNKPGHQTMKPPKDLLRYRIMWFSEEAKDHKDPTKKWSKFYYPGDKADHKGNKMWRYMTDHVYEAEVCVRACKRTVMLPATGWRALGASNDLAEDVAGLQRDKKPWSTLGIWNGNKAGTSKLDTIAGYRIKWSTGSASQWFYPGVNDMDWKKNDYKPNFRRVWSYFEDHEHQVAVCEGGHRCDKVRQKENGPLCADQSGGCADKVAEFMEKNSVVRYKIQWFGDAGWSPYLTVGMDDLDKTGKYAKGTRMSLYFSDHTFKYEKCA